MADINVQQKDRSIWPWVLGLILLAGLIWVLVEMLGDDDDTMAFDDTTPVVAPMEMTEPVTAPVMDTGALDGYLAECTPASPSPAEMSLSHEYTANCVRLLSGALGSVVERDTVGSMALNPALNEFNQTAAELQLTPETSPNHSSMLREVAIGAAELMARVHETRQGPASAMAEVTQVRTAAEAIRGDAPLLEQQRETGDFFREAGEALRALS